MSDEAQLSFELGKKLYEAKKYSEAVGAFAKAVRLDPENLEYRIEYSRSLYQAGQYQKVIEETSRIIESNPNSSVAYRIRAFAKIDSEKASEGLKDITRAIELDPSKARYYGTRAYAYAVMGDLQNAILDTARLNDLLEEADTLPVDENDRESKFIVELINSHFTTQIYPQLKANGEVLVQYWQSFLVWGRETKQVMLNGTTHKQEHGTVGLGYVCLTDQNLRVISLGKLGEIIERERKNSNRGILSFVLSPMRNLMDQTKVSVTDQYWTIPNNTIQGAQVLYDEFLMKDKPMLFIKTPLTTYQILGSPMEELSVAANMAMTGKFSEIWWHKNAKEEASQSKEDVIQLLKNLSELKSKGIITEAEFEEKKKELLSRI